MEQADKHMREDKGIRNRWGEWGGKWTGGVMNGKTQRGKNTPSEDKFLPSVSAQVLTFLPQTATECLNFLYKVFFIFVLCLNWTSSYFDSLSQRLVSAVYMLHILEKPNEEVLLPLESIILTAIAPSTCCCHTEWRHAVCTSEAVFMFYCQSSKDLNKQKKNWNFCQN